MQIISRLTAAAMLLASPYALGSSSHPMDAANAGADVPPVRHESMLSAYIPRQVEQLTDWREANASAGGGGHAGHGSHSAQPGMDNMHQGHDMGQAMPEPPAQKSNPHAGH